MTRLKTLLAFCAAAMMMAAGPAEAGTPKLGAAGVLVMPTGDWGKFQGIGAGAMLTFDVGIDKVKGLQATARAGLIHFLAKEIDTAVGTMDGPTTDMVPIFVGMKYFFAPGLYGGLELGPNFIIPEEGDSEMKIGLTAGLGYMIKNVDLRGFLFMPDLFPEGDKTSATDIMGIGVSAGYRFKAL